MRRLLPYALVALVLAPFLYVGLFAGKELRSLFFMHHRISKHDAHVLGPSDLLVSQAFAAPKASTDSHTFPKILHRMWRDDDLNSMPSRWKKAYQKCEALHGDWDIKLWTDVSMRAFISEYYPKFLNLYDSYPYEIQRVDAARYFILYHYGGIYMDLDIRCLRSLNPLAGAMGTFNKTALLPATGIGLSNDFMASTPRSETMRALIEELPRSNRFYGLPYLTVLLSTGSSFLSIVYDRMSEDEQSTVAILGASLYGHDKEHRLVRHLPGGSWHGADVALLRKFVDIASYIGSYAKYCLPSN